jgi:ribulose-bisphosphate carboxylase small chain
MARITQGTFSLLPDLTDDQIKASWIFNQKGYAVGLEWTDPHPRNCYWELWGLPLFEIPDSATVMYELSECRKAHPNVYIKLNCFNNARCVESTALSYC